MAMSSVGQIKLRPEDLEVILHGGIILTGQLKDLATLRESLMKDSRFKVRYTKWGNVNLYIVTEEEYALIRKLRGDE